MADIEESLQALKLNTEKQLPSGSKNPNQKNPEQQASPSSSDSALACSIVDNAGILGGASSGENGASAAALKNKQQIQQKQQGNSVPKTMSNKYVRSRRRSSTNHGQSVDSTGIMFTGTASKGSLELINPDDVDVELEALAYGGRSRKLSGNLSITEGMYVFYAIVDKYSVTGSCKLEPVTFIRI